MHFKTFTKIFILLLTCEAAVAQSALLPNGALSNYIATRYEIKTGILRNTISADIGPFTRQEASEYLNGRYLEDSSAFVSEKDQFFYNYFLNDNSGWASNRFNNAKHPILKSFYRSKCDFYSVKEKDFQLHLNPVINYFQAQENDYKYSSPIFKNERGLELSGSISNKLGFYTYITDNQSRYANYVNDYIFEQGFIPGDGLYKRGKDMSSDHYTARGHITFQPIKAIQMTYGSIRTSIGNGIRSMILSDFAKDYQCLRVNTKIWRFNYMNIYANLMNTTKGFTPGSVLDDNLLAKKYLAAHYLSYDLLKNLSIGAYEAVMFYDIKNNGRGFDPNYYNPIIFYRAVEHSIGSDDNVLMGLNVNYLPFKGVSLYGQFMLDELRFHEFLGNPGWWGNKYAVQAGVQYIDVFGIKSLDITAEFNAARPYTYSHDSSGGTNYAQYNQSLAHPLGANFSEKLVRIKYVPVKNLFVEMNFMSATKGLDSNGSNFGGNILLDYHVRSQGGDENFIGQGVKAGITRIDFYVSYMIRHNVFIDLKISNRTVKTDLASLNSNSFYVQGGIRINAIPKNLYF